MACPDNAHHHYIQVARQICFYTWKSKDSVSGNFCTLPLMRTFKLCSGQNTSLKWKALPPKASSYGREIIFFVPPENKCWWWRGSGSTHSGLVEIQLERIHKAGTRTKLLAVLVWLCNQTTRSYARTPLETMWYPQWQTMYNLYTSLNLLLTLVSLT